MKTIKVELSNLPNNTKTPILSYCRQLVREGEDPDTRLEVFRNSSRPDVIIPNIGIGARFTIKEEPRLHLVPFKEYTGPSRKRLNSF